MNIIRAFIAIPMPPRVRQRAVSIRERFSHCGAVISWVHEENVHLTIRFLGNVPEEKIESVQEGIRRAVAGTGPFRMEVEEIGVFPNIKYPRILWMGVREPTQTLIALENRISSEMEVLGFPREEKVFSPHITLGRIKSLQGKNRFIQALHSPLQTLEGEKMTVEEVVLFRSELKRSGAMHTVLASIPLEGREGGVI